LTAQTILKEAAEFGVAVTLDGDGIVVAAPNRPPDVLIEKLKLHKLEIVTLLREEISDACAGVPGPVPTFSAYRAALAKFAERRPHGVTRLRHDQAYWAAEMFLGEWETMAAEFGWSADDIFASNGLTWWLGVELVTALGPDHAVTETRRIYDRVTHTDWLNSYGVPGNG